MNERGSQYGAVEECFDRIAQIASIVLNKQITAYDVAMIQVATKLGRLQEARTLDDNYIDMINYTAFAAQFAKRNETPTAMEDDIAEMARKLAPPKREEKTREKNSTSGTYDANNHYAGIHG